MKQFDPTICKAPELPNITFQVIPFSAAIGLLASTFRDLDLSG